MNIDYTYYAVQCQLGVGRVNAYLAAANCAWDLDGDNDVDGREIQTLIKFPDMITGLYK